jgi:hypothetical protein
MKKQKILVKHLWQQLECTFLTQTLESIFTLIFFLISFQLWQIRDWITFLTKIYRYYIQLLYSGLDVLYCIFGRHLVFTLRTKSAFFFLQVMSTPPLAHLPFVARTVNRWPSGSSQVQIINVLAILLHMVNATDSESKISPFPGWLMALTWFAY